MSISVAGWSSAFVVFIVGVSYFVAPIVGFTTRGLTAPIADPRFAIMEG